mmetsp:Transcript_9479/g.29230  ORF Transcript_9479/g.29230 Transcript_9479/m.29230 type:complete len:398 (+) Transcript_9479:1302-2495(+)
MRIVSRFDGLLTLLVGEQVLGRWVVTLGMTGQFETWRRNVQSCTFARRLTGDIVLPVELQREISGFVLFLVSMPVLYVDPATTNCTCQVGDAFRLPLARNEAPFGLRSIGHRMNTSTTGLQLDCFLKWLLATFGGTIDNTHEQFDISSTERDLTLVLPVIDGTPRRRWILLTLQESIQLIHGLLLDDLLTLEVVSDVIIVLVPLHWYVSHRVLVVDQLLLVLGLRVTVEHVCDAQQLLSRLALQREHVSVTLIMVFLGVVVVQGGVLASSGWRVVDAAYPRGTPHALELPNAATGFGDWLLVFEQLLLLLSVFFVVLIFRTTRWEVHVISIVLTVVVVVVVATCVILPSSVIIVNRRIGILGELLFLFTLSSEIEVFGPLCLRCTFADSACGSTRAP